jgi:anti-sigma B factor antagonist
MKQKGSPMCTMDLIEREGGQVVAVLRGELDVTYAASVAARLAVIALRDCDVIVDLAGLEFIDSSGLAALVQARKLARRAGRDLLLAAPQQQVLRLLTVTRLIDAFFVYARVDEAASRVRASSSASTPVALPAVMLAAS